jgi:hypothetical protein
MDNGMELFSSQLVIGYLSAHGLEWLKGNKWFPFMQANAQRLNAVTSAIIALLISIGIQHTFDASVTADGNHVLSFTLVIPSAAQLLHNLFGWARQFVFQRVSYHLFVKGKQSNA